VDLVGHCEICKGFFFGGEVWTRRGRGAVSWGAFGGERVGGNQVIILRKRWAGYGAVGQAIDTAHRTGLSEYG